MTTGKTDRILELETEKKSKEKWEAGSKSKWEHRKTNYVGLKGLQ